MKYLLFVCQIPGSTFTYDEIITVTTLYIHDDTPTGEDSFEITVSDGTNTATLAPTIQVIFTDTTSPFLARDVSLSLYLQENSKAIIGHENLAFSDDDSSPNEITIELRTEPQNGRVQQKLVGDVWEDLHAGSRFTQSDIDSYHIRFVCHIREGGLKSS